jgi:hypothetical protein
MLSHGRLPLAPPSRRHGRAITLRDVDQPAPSSEIHDRHSIADAEFGEDIAHVHMDSSFADAERCGDVFVAHSLGDKGNHIDLSRGHRGVPRPFGKAQPDVRANGPLSPVHFPDDAK